MARENTKRVGSTWQLQDAKARFSKLVKRAREMRPQHVSVHGEPAVVVISEEEFTKLTSPHPSIVERTAAELDAAFKPLPPSRSARSSSAPIPSSPARELKS